VARELRSNLGASEATREGGTSLSDLLLPVVCRSCKRMTLLQVVADRVAPCPRCGSPVVIAPGQIYGAEDIAPFRRIESIIHASELSREDGSEIVAALTDGVRRRRNPEHCLAKVVDVVPALQFLLDSFPVDGPQLARAAGMILTIVTTRTLQLKRSSDTPR
jgi:hypothetical protein